MTDERKAKATFVPHQYPPDTNNNLNHIQYMCPGKCADQTIADCPPVAKHLGDEFNRREGVDMLGKHPAS